MKIIFSVFLFVTPISLFAGTQHAYRLVNDGGTSWIQATWEDVPNTSDMNDASRFYDTMIGSQTQKTLDTKLVRANCTKLGVDHFGYEYSKCVILMNFDYFIDRGVFYRMYVSSGQPATDLAKQFSGDIYIQAGQSNPDGSGGLIMSLHKSGSVYIQIGKDIVK